MYQNQLHNCLFSLQEAFPSSLLASSYSFNGSSFPSSSSDLPSHSWIPNLYYSDNKILRNIVCLFLWEFDYWLIFCTFKTSVSLIFWYFRLPWIISAVCLHIDLYNKHEKCKATENRTSFTSAGNRREKRMFPAYLSRRRVSNGGRNLREQADLP